MAARRRDQRNLLATLLLARGTPMLTMGAESGQSQGGNNNAYAQDNATAWLGWEAANTELAAFTARLAKLRAAHPALTRDRFLTGEAVDATLIPDVEWRNADGSAMQPADWANRGRRTLIAAFYAPADHERSAGRAFAVLHAGFEGLDVVLPETRAGFCWRHCLDTARENGDAGGGTFQGGALVKIEPRSVVVLEEAPAPSSLHKEPDAGRTGVAPELLDRLARAAGIAPEWHDIAGTRHIVPDATKQALLAGMGFDARTSAGARESLGHLADEQDRRLLPATLAAHEGEPIVLRLALADGRTPASLIVEREDGSAAPFRLSPGDLEFAAVTALDGRRVDTVLATLPPQPTGRHRIVTERARNWRAI